MSETPHIIADQIISDQAAAKRAAMLAGLTPEQRAAVEAATDALVKRALADVPMVQAIPGNAVATLEAQSTPAAVKPAVKTFEAWLMAAVAGVGGSLAETGRQTGNSTMATIGSAIMVIIAIVFGYQRTDLKKTAIAGVAPLLICFALLMTSGCGFIQSLVCTEPPSSIDRQYIENVRATRQPSIDALSVYPPFFSEEGKAKLQTILDSFASQEAYEKQKLGETPSKP